MNADRAIGAILAACVAVVVGLGAWLLWRARHLPPPPPPPTPSMTATETPAATATPTGDLPEAARRYRLAGTVVGGMAYAILEGPGGSNELLRPGQVVRGLGQVVEIGEDAITIEGNDGRFEMRITRAPTVTPAPLLPTPAPTPRARSTPGSSPSAGPDRSAS